MAQKTEAGADNRGTNNGAVRDRFDDAATGNRIGAHRVTPRPRYVWQYIIAALLGFAVLTALGVLLVQLAGSAGKLPSQEKPGAGTSETSQSVAPVLDPAATVAILNGTTTPNLAAGVEQAITEQKLGTVVYHGEAEKNDVTISAVFYSDPKDAEAAAGLAKELGGLSSYLTDLYAHDSTQLVVLIGSDYAGPGIDEAKKISDEGENPGIAEPGTDVTVDPETGWVIDQETGLPINPETGLPTDPETGQPVESADQPTQ